MTEHYSGHDPARGCGIALVAAVVLWMLLIATILAVIGGPWPAATAVAVILAVWLALDLRRAPR